MSFFTNYLWNGSYKLQLLFLGATITCLAGCLICFRSRRANLAWMLFVSGWIVAALPLALLIIGNFPKNPPIGLITQLTGLDLLNAERHFAFAMLREIEGAFATVSLAFLFTLPIYFVAKIARANQLQKIRGLVICILIILAVFIVELFRFEIRFGLNWFQREEEDAFEKIEQNP